MPEIRVPKFGMSAVDVEIIEVLVVVGDRVEPGTPVVEAASDKVDLTIESESAGTVAEILCVSGETKAMGEVLIRLD